MNCWKASFLFFSTKYSRGGCRWVSWMSSPMGEESRWGAATAAAPSASHFSRFVLDQHSFISLISSSPPPALYERYRRYTTSALTDFKRWDYIESQTVRLMNRIDFVPAVFIRLPRDFSCFKSPAHFFDDLGTYRPPPPSHTYAHFPMLRQTSRHYIPAIKFKKKKKGQNAQHEMNYNRTTMCVWLRVHRKVVGDVYIIQPMWNKNQTSFYYFRWSRRRRCCCRLVAERVYFLGWVWPSQGEIMGSIFIYICEKIYEKSLSLRQSRFERMSLDLEGKKKKQNSVFLLALVQQLRTKGKRKKSCRIREGGAPDPQRGLLLLVTWERDALHGNFMA